MSEKNRVLIVEGYLAEARVFANILKKKGFTADIAQTCKEAIEKTDRTAYAIAIIDGEIPDSTVILLKLSQTKTIKIVITDSPQEAILNGANACLRKVIKPQELLSTIEQQTR